MLQIRAHGGQSECAEERLRVAMGLSEFVHEGERIILRFSGGRASEHQARGRPGNRENRGAGRREPGRERRAALGLQCRRGGDSSPSFLVRLFPRQVFLCQGYSPAAPIGSIPRW